MVEEVFLYAQRDFCSQVSPCQDQLPHLYSKHNVTLAMDQHSWERV